MRLIGSLDNKKQAQEFSYFLNKEGITNQCEIITNTDWGSEDYGNTTCRIWIYEEDQLEPAEKWFKEFSQNPNDSKFYGHAPVTPFLGTTIEPEMNVVEEEKGKPGVPVIGKKTSWEAQPLGLITLYLIILCIWLFIWGIATAPPLPEKFPANIPLTPIVEPVINKQMLFDYPLAYELIDQLVDQFGVEKLQNPQELPPEGLAIYYKYLQTPYWKGFYEKIVKSIVDPLKSNVWEIKATLFEKIRQGEVWRLFTPCLLHANFIHILFNLIWLMILGKQIENRVGSLRYILFILIAGIFSNTAQYMMSGPNFIGISGVLCAMFAFIWIRQRDAAWEGYQVAPGVFTFLSVFIGAMFGIQIISFFLEIYKQVSLSAGIANTAHLSGLLIGFILGKMKLFSWNSVV